MSVPAWRPSKSPGVHPGQFRGISSPGDIRGAPDFDTERERGSQRNGPGRARAGCGIGSALKNRPLLAARQVSKQDPVEVRADLEPSSCLERTGHRCHAERSHLPCPRAARPAPLLLLAPSNYTRSPSTRPPRGSCSSKFGRANTGAVHTNMRWIRPATLLVKPALMIGHRRRYCR